MSPTPIRDPNAPPDPAELRDIPDHQHVPVEWNTNPQNPVPPVEASDDAPPAEPEPQPPIEPPPDPEVQPVSKKEAPKHKK